MKIIIVRHAQSFDNKNHILSSLSTKLTPLGNEEADRLAQRLLKEDIDVIYCSDLIRCKQTIKPYLKIREMPITYTKELRERDYGKFEGQPFESLQKWLRSNKTEYKTASLPAGESVDDIMIRTAILLKEIFKKEKGRNVLLVTHAETHIALMLNLLNKKNETHYEKFQISNAAISIVEIDEKGNAIARVISSNEHLRGLI